MLSFFLLVLARQLGDPSCIPLQTKLPKILTGLIDGEALATGSITLLDRSLQITLP